MICTVKRRYAWLAINRLISIVALNENDVIGFVANENMLVRNTSSLTTIGDLYDILTILFVDIRSDLKEERAGL